jgi:hypothetical protein
MGIEEDIKKFNKFADHIEQSHPSLIMGFEKMITLSDNEFAQHYLALMSTFKVTEGWWINGNNPICECGEAILSPKELRMYGDNPYHPECFKRVYEKDRRQDSDLMKRYWTKVLKLE